MTIETDRIETLRAEATASILRFGLSPRPVIVLMPPDSKLLSRDELARAVLYANGREEIWISHRLTDRLADAFDHECAHFRAWRDHGDRIKEHGSRWRKICLKYAANRSACESTRKGD